MVDVGGGALAELATSAGPETTEPVANATLLDAALGAASVLFLTPACHSS